MLTSFHVIYFENCRVCANKGIFGSSLKWDESQQVATIASTVDNLGPCKDLLYLYLLDLLYRSSLPCKDLLYLFFFKMITWELLSIALVLVGLLSSPLFMRRAGLFSDSAAPRPYNTTWYVT